MLTSLKSSSVQSMNTKKLNTNHKALSIISHLLMLAIILWLRKKILSVAQSFMKTFWKFQTNIPSWKESYCEKQTMRYIRLNYAIICVSKYLPKAMMKRSLLLHSHVCNAKHVTVVRKQRWLDATIDNYI